MSPRPPAPPTRTTPDPDTAQARRANLVKFVSVAAVLVMVLSVVLVVVLNKNTTDGNITYENAGITLGPGADNVPHVIVYEDFQCPWCAVFHRQAGSGLDHLATNNQINLTYVIRTFLDGDGNTSTLASHAALCAADQDIFAKFHTNLFATHPIHNGTPGHHTGWTIEDLTKTALTAGLPENQTGTFHQCIIRERHTGHVKAMEGRAKLDNATATPTITINGEPLPEQTMQALLEGTTTIEVVIHTHPTLTS